MAFANLARVAEENLVVGFGARGQLGHALVQSYTARGALVAGLTRQQCDVADPNAVRAALRTHAPDLVFNATAYNLVDQAEREPDVAHRLNALIPAQIARAAAQQVATAQARGQQPCVITAA